MKTPENTDGSPTCNRRTFLGQAFRPLLYATTIGICASRWGCTSTQNIPALQEAYDKGHTTSVDVMQRVIGDEVRGCILAGANNRLHLIQLRQFNFLQKLNTHQDLIFGWHGLDQTPPKKGTMIIPEERGSAAVLEDEHHRKVICTNNHVAIHMPHESIWKKNAKHDLAIIDLEHANHVSPTGPDTIRYNRDDLPQNREAAGQKCIVEAYATNALIQLKGIILDAASMRIPGDMAMLVTNSPLPASKYGGMSGSVVRHNDKPIASIHGCGGVLQKGDQILELLRDINDPRYDQCTTVLLSLSGPERLKKILS